jgi:hypothetical protein
VDIKTEIKSNKKEEEKKEKIILEQSDRKWMKK